MNYRNLRGFSCGVMIGSALVAGMHGLAIGVFGLWVSLMMLDLRSNKQ